MKTLVPVTMLLAASLATAQHYSTGRATGYVVLKDKNKDCPTRPDIYRNGISLLAIHEPSMVETTTWKGHFDFTPLRTFTWRITVQWEGYRQETGPRGKPTYVIPQGNTPTAVIEEYICMAKEPGPKPLGGLLLRDTTPFVYYGFGGDPSDQAGQPPASPPSLLPVTGKITDESGAAAKGMVRLYVIRPSKGRLDQIAFARSNRDGEFQFKFDPPVLSGLDRLYISAKGPDARTYSDFVAQDDLAQPLDLRIVRTPRLEPATNPGDIRGITFGPGLMRSLPLPGSRDINSLILLAPGVFPAAETAGLSGPGLAPGIGTAGQFSVNGLRSRQNNFILDGADNTNEETGVPRHGFVFLAPLPVEAVTELQAMTGSADARFGRSAGAQINVLSSSGAAGFHGAAYGYFTDRRLNARNFFDARPSTTAVPLTGGPNNAPVTLDGKPFLLPSPVNRDLPFTRTQAGIVVGGPIAINRDNEPRTFFFAAFEDQLTHAANETHFSVPTVNQRGYRNSGGTGITSSDPRKIALYPSSLAGDAIFSLYPFPNNPAGPFGANTWTEVLPAGGTGHLFSLKLDRYVRAFHANNVITTRYSQTDESSDLPAVDSALFSSVRPKVRTRSFASFFDTNLARHWANTVRFGWGRAAFGFDEKRDPLQLPSSLFPAEPFLLNRPLLFNVTLAPGAPAFAGVLPAQSMRETEQLTGAIGRVNVPGFSSVGVDTFHFPRHQASDTLQWADTLTRTTGRSNLALGFEIWRLSLDSAMERNARPELTFYGQALRVLPRTFPADTGLLDPASVVAAGLVPSFQQTLAQSRDQTLSLHRKQIDFFFQEDFHILPRLTLTAGGRFQVQRLPESDDGRFTRGPDRSLFDKGICKGALESCSSEIDLLANAFPVGFQKAFSAKSFNSDIRIGLAFDPWGTGTSPIRFAIGTYSSQLPATIIDDSRNVFPQLPLNPFLPPCSCGISTSLGGLSDGSSLNLLSPKAAANPVAALALMSSPAALQVVQPAPNLGSPSSLQFSFGVQRRLKGSGFFSVGYVGTRGRDLLRIRVQNATGPPGFALVSILPLGGASHTPAFFGTTVPAFGPGSVSKLLYETTASSRFDSLQSEFRGSLRSLQFGAAFTWSHAIDDASDFFNTTGAFALPQNNTHPSERGSSSFDARLRGTGYFVWDLPRLLKRTMLSGWQLAGTVTAQTGQPFTVNTAFDINNDGILTDRLATTNGLLGAGVGRPISGTSRTTLLSLAPGTNPAALLAPPGSDGIVGRNTFRAGSISSIDLALSKTFAFKERYRVAWRLESFNTANRSNFGIPVRILESPAFGQATRTATPNRILQIAGRFDF